MGLSPAWRQRVTSTFEMCAPLEAYCINLDKATPKLMQYASNGAHISKVEVTLCRQAGDKPIAYLKYEFEDVVVTSYEPTGDADGDGLPEEKVGLSYGKIKATYTDSDSTGKALGQIAAEFDRRSGKSA